MELLFSIGLGICLSAACGFRIFVPIFATSLAAHAGHLQLASGFEWLGTEAAVITFGVATAVEIAAYYIPWVDNALDVLATPTAIIAGTMLTASMISDTSPLLQWSLAVIVGGGVSGAVQLTTDFARFTSTATTAGLANPLLSTMEWISALIISLLVLFLPVLAIVIVVAVLWIVAVKLHHRLIRRST